MASEFWRLGCPRIFNEVATRLNLLKSNLAENKNNVVISFDPLIEGKQTVSELLELFYLKVIQQVANKAIKKAFKKLFLSMLTIIRFKTSLQFNDPSQCVALSLEKDWADDVEKFIRLWEKNVQQLPSQQFQEINSILLRSGIKLYVFIDEIDRLSSEQIIPFLLFSRVMESIEPLVCLMGLDYNRTIRKLVVENKLGSSSYNDVKFYLDKLITLTFHVEATLDNRVEFLSELLITHHICNKEFVHEFSHQLREICYYLVTPRGIKKLVILASANKQLIDFSGNSILFLQLLAIEVKNPIIKEYLAKHENILHLENIKNEPGYSHLLNNHNPESQQDILNLNNKIKKVLLGIIDPNLRLTEADSVALIDMTPYFITDHFSSRNIRFLEGSVENVSFKNNSIKNFTKEQIIEILNIWLQKLSSSLEKKDPNLVESDNSIGLFYRYIQWGKALGQDNRGKLSEYVSSVLKKRTVSEETKINFCQCVISAGDLNASFPQKNHRHVIFEEFFGSSSLQSIIEDYAAK